MLVEFSVENFKSYGERQTLYMQPKTDNLADQYQIKTNIESAPTVLPAVGIFGANASGKSGLLEAIRELDIIIETSAERKKTDTFEDERFKLNPIFKNKPTTFDISFLVKNKGIYQYILSLYPEKIVREELIFTTPKNEKTKIIIRNEKETILDKSIHENEKFLDIWKADINDQRTFLAYLGNKGDVTLFDDVLKCFNNILFWDTNHIEAGITPALISKNQQMKVQVNDLLTIADLHINDIIVDKNEVEVPRHVLERVAADMAKEGKKTKTAILKLLPKTHVEISTRLEHSTTDGNTILFDLEEESMGTQAFYSLLGPLFAILDEGRLLIVDEINKSLHPYLVRRIIQLFTSPLSNPNGAQLLFTTHDVTVLDERLLKRDQIYFTEKDSTSYETSLYSLSEFEEGSVEEFYKKDYPLPILLLKYLEGLYGAVPQIDWSSYNGKTK